MGRNLKRLIVPAVLLIVFSVIGSSRISFNVNALDLLPSGLPEVEAFERLMKNFSRENELIITLEAKEDPYLAEDAMRSLVSHLQRGLAEDISSIRGELPLFEDPELGAELIAWLWLNGDPANLKQLASRLDSGATTKQLSEAMEELQSGFFSEKTVLLGYDPLELTTFEGNGTRGFLSGESNGFQSSSGEFRVIYIEASVPKFASYIEAGEWVDKVRAAVQDWKEASADEFDIANLTIDFTGEPTFTSEISRSMQNDMVKSVLFTTVLICILFWLMHRQLTPLFWLMVMLAVVFSATFAAGGLILGQLSAMSIGFAAILIGLAVDYGVVLYREREAANGSVKFLRWKIGSGILWAAATTAAVFVSMNFSSLPGIRELGTLVALGILIGALVMLGLFAPVVAETPVVPETGKRSRDFNAGAKPVWWITGATIVAGISTILAVGWPGVNRESRPFNLKNSPAMAAFEKLSSEMHDGARTLPVIVSGKDYGELAGKLAEAQLILQRELDSGAISEMTLPTVLAPHPANQAANLAVLESEILGHESRLIDEVLKAGFTAEATALTGNIFHEWTGFVQRTDPVGSIILPDSDAARWLLSRMVGTARGEIVVLGEVIPVDEDAFVDSLPQETSGAFQLAGWPVLIPALHELIEKDFMRVFLPMGVILLVMLMLVFRDWRDVCLSLVSILFGGLMLLTLTLWFPIEWNFFNLTGIPILFGTGLDFGIHMIFSLRRSKGNLAVTREGIGKALLFCGCSTAVGFGSLSFAGTQGLSSMGLICGLGIILNMITAVWLLPHWWRAAHAKQLAEG